MSPSGYGGPPQLSRLAVAGAGGMRVVFGADGEGMEAAELMVAGLRSFSGSADADVVGVLMTNDRPTVEVVLGALAAGVRLVSLPPPGRGADLEEYAALLRGIRERYELAEVVAADDLAVLLEGVGVPARAHSAMGRAPLAAPRAGGFELVQFTSGSTRQPRPVVLSDVALGANVTAMLEVVAPRPGDTLVSWLPLAHDMGLVGMLLTGLAAGAPEWTGGADVVLLDPRAFLRRPAAWVEALSRWDGTFTAAPDFAFWMAAQRGPRGGVDLSSLRCAIVGGEIVRADTLERFTAAFAGCGFDPVALCPAYGMAELGVAATLTPPAVLWRELAVDTLGLADDQVRPTRGHDGTVTRLVASGAPLPGYEVRARAPGAGVNGLTGPDRFDGSSGLVERLAVRGPSVGVDGTTGSSFAGDDGWFSTGDVGFVEEGGLYVCGRTDDWVVTHGRKLHAPTVEVAVGEVAGVRAGRVTAVGLPTGGWVVVAEPFGRSPLRSVEIAPLQREIRRVAVDTAAARPDEVVVVAPGSLPLTSSGKLQRNQVRARFLRGELVQVDPAATVT
jgi:fatty-acyl-CoA synthase